MSRLPVVDKTAWVNPGNRPEKVTARSTRLSSSVKGSIGGKALHMTAAGIGAVVKAPRLHSATPLTAPIGRKLKIKGPTPSPKPSMCPCCGLWFESINKRGKHQHTCVKEGAD